LRNSVFAKAGPRAWRLIGESVRVTLADGQLRVTHAGQEVAVHQRCTGRFERRVDPLHFAGVVGFRSKAAVVPLRMLPIPNYCAR
jgi:hypothetical protein